MLIYQTFLNHKIVSLPLIDENYGKINSMNQKFINRLIKTLQLSFVDFRVPKNDKVFINVDPYQVLDAKNEVEVNVIILNKYLLQFIIKYEL
jgi:hypothetical protein